MKYWQAISFCELDQLEAIAQEAEALGFCGVTLSDHLVTLETQTQVYDYSDDGQVLWNPETPWPDPWVQFAALARVTSRLQFMTTVYVLPLRDPFTMAKSIATAACVAGAGRIHLGVGVGWQRQEFELVGQAYEGRGRRADEQLEVLDKLWSGEMVEHSGEFYSFPRLQMSPAPPSKIPILVGGHAPVAFRRAARHDGWVGQHHPYDELVPLLESATAARAHSGGSMGNFRLMAGCVDLTVDRLRRLKGLGMTDYLRPTWLSSGRVASVPLEEKLADMRQFAESYFNEAELAPEHWS